MIRFISLWPVVVWSKWFFVETDFSLFIWWNVSTWDMYILHITYCKAFTELIFIQATSTGYEMEYDAHGSKCNRTVFSDLFRHSVCKSRFAVDSWGTRGEARWLSLPSAVDYIWWWWGGHVLWFNNPSRLDTDCRSLHRRQYDDHSVGRSHEYAIQWVRSTGCQFPQLYPSTLFRQTSYKSLQAQ